MQYSNKYSNTVASLNASRQKARDATRLSDSKEIEKAIELYYDKYNRYPPIWAKSQDPNSWNALGNALNEFITLPKDPINTGYYEYFYEADSGDNYQTYGLMFKFEHSGNSNLSLNDSGGYFIEYEIGSQPKFCKKNYNRGWFNQGVISVLGPGQICVFNIVLI